VSKGRYQIVIPSTSEKYRESQKSTTGKKPVTAGEIVGLGG
jgi:hypothetical protein